MGGRGSVRVVRAVRGDSNHTERNTDGSHGGSPSHFEVYWGLSRTVDLSQPLTRGREARIDGKRRVEFRARVRNPVRLQSHDHLTATHVLHRFVGFLIDRRLVLDVGILHPTESG